MIFPEKSSLKLQNIVNGLSFISEDVRLTSHLVSNGFPRFVANSNPKSIINMQAP